MLNGLAAILGESVNEPGSPFTQIPQRLQGRITPRSGEGSSEQQAVAPVEIEQLDGGFADIGQRHDTDSVQTKVVCPLVLSRMVEADDAARAADESSDIGSLGDIAAQAGQGEVRSRGGAAMLPADDVIHMKRELGVVLVDQTVFAEARSPLDDETAQASWNPIRHAATGTRGRRRTRARALARLIT